MNKEEYLAQLKKYLKRLPAEDYQNAMDYFTEYFEEAGPEGEAEAIKELGTPKEAAAELLSALLDEKITFSSLPAEIPSNSGQGADSYGKRERYQYRGEEPIKKKYSPFSTIMIAFLAILAAPIGAPLAISVVVLLLCGILFIGCCLLAFFIFSVAIVFSGAVLMGTSFGLIASSVPSFCIMIGLGLFGIGCGILLFIASCYICKWIGIGIVRFAQWITRERKVKHHE